MTFEGLLQLDGVEIGRTTTKAALQGRIRGQIKDHSGPFPGFTVIYADHEASFHLTKDPSALLYVSITWR
jgi:hypothetical protein